MSWNVNPLRGKTTNRRAVCGRSARTVRREGEVKLSLPLCMGRAFSPQTKSIDLSMHSGFMTYA